MSCSTDSPVPSIITAGTHRTRVSEMRLASGTGGVFHVKRSPVPVAATRERGSIGVQFAGANIP